VVIPSVYRYTRTQPQFEFGGLVETPNFVPDFVARMASLHNETFPCSLLQRLIKGTSPLVCANLKMKREVPMLIKEQ